MIEITSAEQYRALREKIRLHDEEVRSIIGDEGGAYDPAVLVKPIASNDEKSAVETYEVQFNPPAKLFVYVHSAKYLDKHLSTNYGEGHIVATWTGQKLGMITAIGEPYRGGFGSIRQSLRFRAINGFDYAATYYSGSGNYARAKLVLPYKGWRLDRFNVGWNDTVYGLSTYDHKASETIGEWIECMEKITREQSDKRRDDGYLCGVQACLLAWRAMGDLTPRR